MMKPSTERDYRRRIARVVEIILLEPGAPHTLESLAAVAHDVGMGGLKLRREQPAHRDSGSLAASRHLGGKASSLNGDVSMGDSLGTLIFMKPKPVAS